MSPAVHLKSRPIKLIFRFTIRYSDSCIRGCNIQKEIFLNCMLKSMFSFRCNKKSDLFQFMYMVILVCAPSLAFPFVPIFSHLHLVLIQIHFVDQKSYSESLELILNYLNLNVTHLRPVFSAKRKRHFGQTSVK